MSISLESKNKCNKELKKRYFEALQVLSQIVRKEKDLWACVYSSKKFVYKKINNIPEEIDALKGNGLQSLYACSQVDLNNISIDEFDDLLNSGEIIWIGDVHSDGRFHTGELCAFLLGEKVEIKPETYFNFDL